MPVRARADRPRLLARGPVRPGVGPGAGRHAGAERRAAV